MKWIIAIIQPHRLEAVKQCLTEVEVFRLTVSDVQGYGRQKGHTELYRGAEYIVDLLPKIKIEAVVSDNHLETSIEAIQQSARTDKVGDGKIFVCAIDQVLRIRTGETGNDAL